MAWVRISFELRQYSSIHDFSYMMPHIHSITFGKPNLKFSGKLPFFLPKIANIEGVKQICLICIASDLCTVGPKGKKRTPHAF